MSAEKRDVPRLCIILPCYNEEEVLPSTIEQLSSKLLQLVEAGSVAADSFALFVDDGSKDRTWRIIEATSKRDTRFQGVKLAHNRGHQNALVAGYEQAIGICDACVSMDADLQDDLDAIDQMVEKYRGGADIVFGVRDNRASDSGFKRGTAKGFYRFMRWLGADTIDNHADFRLMSTEALKALAAYGETNLFLRGLVTDIGLATDIVYYARKERMAGESKYPLSKMVSFAMQGVTSFSIKPLHIIGVLGIIAVVIAVVAIVYSIVSWALGHAISGWTTTVVSIWFIGGVQLICLAVLGEYIGKIYFETKRRPRYLIQTRTYDGNPAVANPFAVAGHAHED